MKNFFKKNCGCNKEPEQSEQQDKLIIDEDLLQPKNNNCDKYENFFKEDSTKDCCEKLSKEINVIKQDNLDTKSELYLQANKLVSLETDVKSTKLTNSQLAREFVDLKKQSQNNLSITEADSKYATIDSLNNKQDKLVAGTNIVLRENTISVSDNVLTKSDLTNLNSDLSDITNKIVSILANIKSIETDIKDNVKPDLVFEKGTGEASIQSKNSNNEAAGAKSFVIGNANVTGVDPYGSDTNLGAVAEGNGTAAYGDGAHAEGSSGQLAIKTNAVEVVKNSTSFKDIFDHYVHLYHTEGIQMPSTNFGALALGVGAHSEGFQNVALGDGAHAEGIRNIAAQRSNKLRSYYGGQHANGVQNIANGIATFVTGSENIAYNPNEAAFGRGNRSRQGTTPSVPVSDINPHADENELMFGFKEDTIFTIGCTPPIGYRPKDSEDRHNAFEVLRNGAINIRKSVNDPTMINLQDVIAKNTTYYTEVDVLSDLTPDDLKDLINPGIYTVVNRVPSLNASFPYRLYVSTQRPPNGTLIITQTLFDELNNVRISRTILNPDTDNVTYGAWSESL